MPDERVGMVSRVAEMERGMADGRDGLTVDGVSDLVGRKAGGESALAGRNNPIEVIEFEPNSSGGLVVEHNQRIRLAPNSNNQSLTEFENLGSEGNQSVLDIATIEQLGGVCRKTKSVNAIVEGLLSPAQRVVIVDARRIFCALLRSSVDRINMRLLSWNVLGLGGAAKCSGVRGVVRRHMCDMGEVQDWWCVCV
ncbi:hypothetical protein V6N13_024850 [Hibiscus sabdariffa]